MKKRFFLLSLMMAMMPLVNLQVSAADNIPLQSGIIDPDDGQENPHRTPITSPRVSLDAHTLYLNNVGYDLTLVLLDDDGDEAYTTFVSAGTSAVVLPATLSGDYEIQLYPSGSSYYFFGWVEL